MPTLIGINVGFITNSSSVVYHFPVALLKDPRITSFLQAYEIGDGFIGDDLWARNRCGTLAVTREQKMETGRRLSHPDYGASATVDIDDENSFVVVIGDEHNDIAAILARMLTSISEEQGVHIIGHDYN